MKAKARIALIVIFSVLIIDQITKIWVKTNMPLYGEIEVFSWFKILFVENPGMAFGMEFIGKLYLTLFRIIFICFIAYYLYRIIQAKQATGYIACIALMWAGAFGNIIDSVIYGEIFSMSEQGHVASLVPYGEGYSSLLHGKVVDMLYFPLIETSFPSWMPIWGGQDFVFFSPIFNIADSAITVSIFCLAIFYRKDIGELLEKKKPNEAK